MSEGVLFPDSWKVSSVVPAFKNAGERSKTKNYSAVSLLSMVSNVKLVNNRIVDHLKKCGLFSDFQYGIGSSKSTTDLLTVLTVVFDRIVGAFNRSGATWAPPFDISKASDRVCLAGLLHKLKSYGISDQIFGLISSFLSNRWIQVVLNGNSSQKYPVNAGAPEGSILGATLFLLHINDFPDVICGGAIYADDMTLCSKYDQTSDMWQQLELASKRESDLSDFVDWGRKWLVDFNTRKTQLIFWTVSYNTAATVCVCIVKWMGLLLKKNHPLRSCGWFSFLNWIGTLTLSLILLKLPPRKLET